MLVAGGVFFFPHGVCAFTAGGAAGEGPPRIVDAGSECAHLYLRLCQVFASGDAAVMTPAQEYATICEMHATVTRRDASRARFSVFELDVMWANDYAEIYATLLPICQ